MHKYILFLFLVFVVSAKGQKMEVKSFTQAVYDLTARVEAPVKDQNGEVCALIKIRTIETGFSFEGDGLGISKTVQKKGEVWVYVPAGANLIKIKHGRLGILEYDYPVKILSATVYAMDLYGVSNEVYSILVERSPASANVFLDGKAFGKVHEITNVKPGEHIIRLEQPGYNSLSDTLLVCDGRIKFNFDLVPLEVTVHFKSNPGYARVFVDSVELGRTNFQHKIAVGKHHLRMEKEDYRIYEKDIEVKFGEPNTFSCDLLQSLGQVELNVKPEHTKTFVYDNDNEIMDLKGDRIFELNPGLYYLRFEAPEYKKHEESIEVIKDDLKHLSIKLDPKTHKGTAIVWSLLIPGGGQLYSNGQNGRGIAYLAVGAGSAYGFYFFNKQINTSNTNYLSAKEHYANAIEIDDINTYHNAMQTEHDNAVKAQQNRDIAMYAFGATYLASLIDAIIFGKRIKAKEDLSSTSQTKINLDFFADKGITIRYKF